MNLKNRLHLAGVANFPLHKSITPMALTTSEDSSHGEVKIVYHGSIMLEKILYPFWYVALWLSMMLRFEKGTKWLIGDTYIGPSQ